MQKILIGSLVCVLCLTACGKKNTVIAKIGSDKITAAILENRIAEAPPSYITFLQTEAGKKQFLDLVIRERIVMESARRAKLQNSKEYKETLDAYKKDQARRLRDYQESLLMELYIRQLNDKIIAVTPGEVEKYYQENKKDFVKPLEITAKHILLDTKEEAEKILARIKNGEDFSKLAKVFSKDAVSAAREGIIGPFKKGDLVPEFEKAVFPLKINQISSIIKTEFGYHIIKKTSEKVLPSISFEDGKGYIQNIIQKTKFDQWLSKSKEKLGFKVYYDRLKKVAVKLPDELSAMTDNAAQRRPKPAAEK